MERYYRLLLDDYSAASFTSFSKEYFGQMEDMDSFFKAIQEDEDTSERFKDLLSAYEQYKAGDRKIMHNVAYQDVPFLVPAKILGSETSELTNYAWDHTNTWDCIYKMRCEKAESTHIWVSCYGRYFRCIRTKFTNLEYKNTLKEYKSHEGWTWGFPHQLEYEPPITENRLFVVEKIFRNKVETINDRNNLINNPDPKFGSVLDDLFGDG